MFLRAGSETVSDTIPVPVQLLHVFLAKFLWCSPSFGLLAILNALLHNTPTEAVDNFLDK